jgi:starch phosphorylase
MVCADFDAYVAAEALAARCYRDQRDWSRRSLFNIVGGSKFSSDNTIRQYAKEIWSIDPVKTDLQSVSFGAERTLPESGIHSRSRP